MTNDTKAVLLEKFLVAYRTPSFGALPKREIDLLVMNLLFKTQVIDENDSDQKISRQLFVAESKVRALRYELDVRNQALDDKWIKRELIAALEKASVFTAQDQGRIALHVRRPLLRKEIEDLLAKDNSFADYSFNRDLLILRAEAFGKLLDYALEDKQRQQIEKNLQEALKQKKSSEIDWTALLGEFLMSAAKSSGKAAGEKVVGAIAALLTGGISEIVPFLRTPA